MPILKDHSQVEVDLIRDDLTVVETEIDTKVDGPFWDDMLGDISARTTGAGSPTLAAFRGGNVRAWFYAVGDMCDVDYHVKHDYIEGTDIFLHLHWGHHGTQISGQLTVQISVTVAKGHNQTVFPAEKVFNMVIPATDLTVAPRYGHIVSEIQLSSNNPTATQIHNNEIEPDAKILINAKAIANPTITGGVIANPYWLGLDIHYLSRGRGTKNKSPNFYI